MATPLQLWLEKKTYLEQQLAITSDPSQKFALREQIKECEQEIVRLSNQSQPSTPNQNAIQTQHTIPNKQLSAMKLTGQEKEQLQQALIDAFNHSSLKQMLTFKLDKDLDTITTANGFSNIVFDLINIADKGGWISQLITSAKEDNPGNQLLANTSAILLAKQNQQTTNNSTTSQTNNTKNMSNLELINLIERTFTRSEVKAIWLELFNSNLDDVLPNRDFKDVITEMISRSNKQNTFSTLINSLKSLRPDITQKLDF